jgi:hypothetical protein
MSHNELKIEIQKLLDNIPDTVLEEILVVLKDIEAKSKINDDYLTKIFSEDKEVLQKLAQ